FTWALIPFLQSWERSGEMEPKKRAFAAIKENLVYYLIAALILGALLVYIFVAGGYTPSKFMALIISAANAYGLLICTLLLGYGAVDFPRSVWYYGSTRQRLCYLEFNAPRFKEASFDTENEYHECARTLAYCLDRIDSSHELWPFVQKMLATCSDAADPRFAATVEIHRMPEIDEAFLVGLNYRLKSAILGHRRAKAQLQFLIDEADMLSNALENAHNASQTWISDTAASPVPGNWYSHVYSKCVWIWYVHARQPFYRGLAIMLALVSLVLVWSESLFQIDTKPPLSVPALAHQDPRLGLGYLEALTFVFICYICALVYGTLFQVRIFDYVILPKHHSDNASILFLGSWTCRLTFPIIYNFLQLLRDEENSVFVEYIGKSVNLAPLLGEQYNRWLPMAILLLALITLFNLHGRVLRLFGIKEIFYQPDPNDREVAEGRRVIEAERSQHRVRHGSAGSASSARDPSAFNSKTARLLQRYQAGRDGSREDLLPRGRDAELGQSDASPARQWSSRSPPASSASSRVFGNSGTSNPSIQGLWDSNPGFTGNR
ncbi:MAG: hypothetical protein SGCHY_003213, partial [Lobulomycetales sp.]